MRPTSERFDSDSLQLSPPIPIPEKGAGRISAIASQAEFTTKSVETHTERVTLVYRIRSTFSILPMNSFRECPPMQPSISRSQPLGIAEAIAPAVRAEGLVKRFPGVTAVDHLNLEVHPGEIFSMV